MQERLQKILSARGICSRRKAEEFIEKGFIKINGKIAELGQKADPEKDNIEVDGAVIESRKELIYYVMNKPKGIVTTNAERRDQETVFEVLPKKLQSKISPVGRLDKDSSGLLLFTNDGVLAYRLTHPKSDHEKEYEVITVREITDGALNKLKKGMTISGSKTKPAKVRRLSQNKFTIALTEGKNRQIRRMCQKVGCPVNKLKRIRIMTLEDQKLRDGETRQLSSKEKADLLKAVGL